MRAMLVLLFGFTLAGYAAETAGRDAFRLDLSGDWAFQLDPKDEGLAAKWSERNLPDKIKLPGCLPAQGIGDDVTVNTKWTGGIVDRSWFTAPEYAKYREPGNVKVPFWLQPEKHYAGAAWYQRSVEVPAAWQQKRVTLTLERPHWETRVWLDTKEFGSNNSLSTPHAYDLGFVAAGKHQLTIRVDNRMVVDVGHDSHSVSDHTQGNWNGIVGRVELRGRDPVWIEAQRVFPKNDGTVRVEVAVRNELFDPVSGTISVSVSEKATGKAAGKGRTTFEYPRGTMADGRHILTTVAEHTVTLKLDEPPKVWSEFGPELYVAESRIETVNKLGDATAVTFGFRELSTQGTQFVLNGQKIFFRGTLECCIFPLTGHPPTDVDSWKRIVRIAKAHGLNHIRFHSWCPPEAAFAAADELGFYYQVECASWANSTTGLGQGKPIDKWLYEETDRILAAYGNHPSFMLLPYGNEPGGNHAPYLAQWVNHYKQKDPRRLYTSASGWPQLKENQFHVTPDPRIQGWGAGLKSRINARPPETRTDYRDYIRSRSVPAISHEIGQWCVYPNFDEIPKYTGYLKPRNFEIFRDTLNEHHMGDQAKQFLLASGKLQALCYKEEIESALRTPGMGGFQLLDLHDFPGQGTALVGILDPFWDSKGYITPEEHSRFCNSTVPLARLAKRVFNTAEKLDADIAVAHFGPAPLQNAVAQWKLVADGGAIVATGALPATTVPVDNGIALGSISAALTQAPKRPSHCKLVVGLEGTRFENDWDVWVYPATVDTQPPQDVRIAEALDDHAVAALDAGGKVLLLVPPSQVKGDKRGKVALGFSSIFWNTAWTHRQPPHTLGILCDPKHAALAEFPTEYHSNWQWWYLVTRAGTMILDDLPAELRPLVQVVDDWVTNRKLALAFEAKVRKGKLLVCSMDLQSDLEKNLVARQMRHSLLRYMAQAQFNPAVELTVEQVRSLMAAPAAARKWSAKADSEAPDYDAAKAVDGNPETIWHTAWEPAPKPMPHELVIDLGKEAALAGITYLPRQDMANGRIADFEVYVGNDLKAFGAAVAKGKWPNTDKLQKVVFEKPAKGRYVKLVALSEVKGNPFAAAAEVDVIPAF